MTCLNPEEAYEDGGIPILQCDRCKKIYPWGKHGSGSYAQPLIDHLWSGINRPKDMGDFCETCAKQVAPKIYALRDIHELKTYVNKLERTINETRSKRTENNRTTSTDAG